MASMKKRNGAPLEAKADKDNVVRSIDRALDLLEILARDGGGCRLVDLAERAGLSPSTTHRLLTTLEQRRFVQFDRDSTAWHVGAQSFSVGINFLRHQACVAYALPFMRQLRDRVGETVNLGIRNGDEVMFLTRVENRDVLDLIARPGGRSPLHCSGMGKAFLAATPDAELRDILRRRGMPARTAKTIDRPLRLQAALGDVRRLGFAFDDEENGAGLRCIASLIYDEAGRPAAAISVSGPTGRLVDGHIAAIGAAVRGAAAEITGALGGRIPA